MTLLNQKSSRISGTEEIYDLIPCTSYDLEILKGNETVHHENFRTEAESGNIQPLERFEVMENGSNEGTGVKLTWRDRCTEYNRVKKKHE